MTTSESFVHFGLILKVEVLGFHRFESDANLLSGDDVDPKVNVTWSQGC